MKKIIKKIVEQMLKTKQEISLKDNKTLSEMGLDCADMANLVRILENSYSINLPEIHELKNMTVGQLSDYVTEKYITREKILNVITNLAKKILDISVPKEMSVSLNYSTIDSLDFVVFEMELERAIYKEFDCYLSLELDALDNSISWNDFVDFIFNETKKAALR